MAWGGQWMDYLQPKRYVAERLAAVPLAYLRTMPGDFSARIDSMAATLCIGDKMYSGARLGWPLCKAMVDLALRPDVDERFVVATDMGVSLYDGKRRVASIDYAYRIDGQDASFALTTVSYDAGLLPQPTLDRLVEENLRELERAAAPDATIK